MKKLINIILGSVLLFTSCDRFFDVNTDPNNPSSVPYDVVFPAATASSAAVIGGQFAILGSLWSQHFTQNNTANQYKTWDSYKLTASDFNSSFDELYSGAINDYMYVQREAEAIEDWNTYLMATLLKCYTYQVLADLYDQIPYTEVGLGVEGNVSPKYDDGSVVYDGLIEEIDQALGKDFAAYTNKNIGNKDFIFGGDMAKWKQFANTLKLKIYLRQLKVRPDVARAGIANLFQNGADFLTVAACMDKYLDESGKQNPLYASEVASTGLNDPNLRASKTLFDYLYANGDERYTFIYKPEKGFDYIAQAQGDYLSQEHKNELSRGLWNPVQPVYFFTLAEVEFLQAEALVRYPDLGGNAQEKYESGIKASFDLLGAEGVENLLTGSYRFPAGSENQLEAIITQKWIACAKFNPIESFFEFNRTGYPKSFTVSKNSAIGGKFPQRLLFAADEVARNPNTPAQVAIDVPVWWAK